MTITSMHLQLSSRADTYERSAISADDIFLRHLFATSLTPLPGLRSGQAQVLTEMQFRGREQTYMAWYPDADSRILSLPNGASVGRVLREQRSGYLRLRKELCGAS